VFVLSCFFIFTQIIIEITWGVGLKNGIPLKPEMKNCYEFYHALPTIIYLGSFLYTILIQQILCSVYLIIPTGAQNLPTLHANSEESSNSTVIIADGGGLYEVSQLSPADESS